jgi:hypothetical protein
VRFVDVLERTEAHSACAPADERFVAGVSLTGSSDLRRIDLKTGALHPNGRGVAYLTDQMADAIRELAG